MAAVLKTVDRKVRGFESCSLRQKYTDPPARVVKMAKNRIAERWLSGRKRSPAKRLYALQRCTAGSNPALSAIRSKKILRPWLSWIERQTTNLNVASSNLAGRTNKNKGLGKTLNPLFISLLPYCYPQRTFFMICICIISSPENQKGGRGGALITSSHFPINSLQAVKVEEFY